MAAANAVAACPDGNEVESGSAISGWTDSSASGGRARSVISLINATARAATPAARLAESAQTREADRRRESPIAPNAAMSGHFTHHADARTKKAVRGSQRMDWVAAIARSSHWARRSNTGRLMLAGPSRGRPAIATRAPGEQERAHLEEAFDDVLLG